MNNFLFWLFLFGIGLASLQDLKRREVDNWLNYFLTVSGGVFLIFSALFKFDFYIILYGVLCFFIMFLLGNIFYYSKIFAGGDARLVVAMFALFVSSSFFVTLTNIGIFVLFLFFAGSIYGLFFTFFLFLANFRKVGRQLKKEFRDKFLIIGVMISIIFLLLTYFDFLFLEMAIFGFLSVFLFALARAIEKTIMIKEISSKKAREGDWLVEDVCVKGKRIISDWEGLMKKDLKLLSKVNRKIKIKQGIPFVPAILIAFLSYYFFKEFVIEFLRNLLNF